MYRFCFPSCKELFQCKSNMLLTVSVSTLLWGDPVSCGFTHPWHTAGPHVCPPAFRIGPSARVGHRGHSGDSTATAIPCRALEPPPLGGTCRVIGFAPGPGGVEPSAPAFPECHQSSRDPPGTLHQPYTGQDAKFQALQSLVEPWPGSARPEVSVTSCWRSPETKLLWSLGLLVTPECHGHCPQYVPPAVSCPSPAQSGLRAFPRCRGNSAVIIFYLSSEVFGSKEISFRTLMCKCQSKAPSLRTGASGQCAPASALAPGLPSRRPGPC